MRSGSLDESKPGGGPALEQAKSAVTSGDRRVDAVLRQLDDAQPRPVAEQQVVFERLADDLAEILGDLDGAARPDEPPGDPDG